MKDIQSCISTTISITVFHTSTFHLHSVECVGFKFELLDYYY